MYGNGAQEDRDAFEGGLGAAMKQTGEGFSVTGRPLVDGAVTRGRRRMVLRRSAVVTGSVAAIAVIGLGGSLVTGDIGASQDGGNGSAVAARSTENANRSAGPSKRHYSAQQVIRTLEGLLPKGKFSEQTGRGTSGTGDQKSSSSPYASVVYDDGQGKAAVSVSLRRQSSEAMSENEFSCPDNPNVHEGCSAITLADGSRLVLSKGREHQDGQVETKRWHADLLTPEGYRISVSESNATGAKDAPVSRSTPPLSLDRMKVLAQAREWHPILASLPEPAAPSTAPEPLTPQGQSGDVVLGKLPKLLPDRLAVKASGKQEAEYAYVEGDLFDSDVKVLADGTKAATRQGAGEKGGEGGKMRQVDTIRPSGLRVVVPAFNTEDQNEAPALSLTELEKIATGTLWQS
ncbi:hypothetical protein OG242_12615 [Streptomyces sp. NBC_00727]|uniref:hypothetical protein n=1 Tax=Streptomyces sp. NBC_00727 TaxID=2903675 RepID=UPI00386687CB